MSRKGADLDQRVLPLTHQTTAPSAPGVCEQQGPVSREERHGAQPGSTVSSSHAEGKWGEGWTLKMQLSL